MLHEPIFNAYFLYMLHDDFSRNFVAVKVGNSLLHKTTFNATS